MEAWDLEAAVRAGRAMISLPQYRKLMKTYQQNANLSQSAEHAGVDRKTARKYIRGDAPPPGSEAGRPRNWKTHQDVFAQVWKDDVEPSLMANPRIKAKHLFRQLQQLHPGRFKDGMLRTFQRRVALWHREQRALDPATRTLYFPQRREPGHELQLDWFDACGLGVSIAGKDLSHNHKICHVVLPWSNWESASVCRSESFLSLRGGLQKALTQLGGAPRSLQIDNSSTATHQLSRGKRERGFNRRFVDLLDHFGMQPRAINIGAANENGDVESSHRHLREYLDAQLTFRGHRDFESQESWQSFIDEAVIRRNAERGTAVEREKMALRALPPVLFPEFDETVAYLNKYGLARVAKHGYSIPSAAVGDALRVRVYDTHLEFYRADQVGCGDESKAPQPLAVHVRLVGDSDVHIDWRHLLPELLRKPGAFARYQHRSHFFPGTVWRKAHDTLAKTLSEKRLNIEYLNLLGLALEHGKERLEALLQRLIAENRLSLDAARRELGVVDIASLTNLTKGMTTHADPNISTKDTESDSGQHVASGMDQEEDSAALRAQLHLYDTLITPCVATIGC